MSCRQSRQSRQSRHSFSRQTRQRPCSAPVKKCQAAPDSLDIIPTFNRHIEILSRQSPTVPDSPRHKSACVHCAFALIGPSLAHGIAPSFACAAQRTYCLVLYGCLVCHTPQTRTDIEGENRTIRIQSDTAGTIQTLQTQRLHSPDTNRTLSDSINYCKMHHCTIPIDNRMHVCIASGDGKI